ncbi:unnamed protein product [Orchesella dallaii]|uniref:C2H2-type domain-containing protein n=1 Tax=Orchesella dallaii TaxID=48710 RepID=A0ABP1QGG7_9HEXA
MPPLANTEDSKPCIRALIADRIDSSGSGSSISKGQHVARRHPQPASSGIHVLHQLPMRYAGYDGSGSATVIRHNSFGMGMSSSHPLPFIPRSRLPPGVNPSMVRHRVFVIPKQAGQSHSSVKAICQSSPALVVRRHVPTSTRSVSTEVSTQQWEEMEKKVADFHIYKAAFEDKMRKEMESKEKSNSLENQVNTLTKENLELRDKIEKLMEVVQKTESEKQNLIQKASDEVKEFKWKQSCYQNEIQRFEKRLQKMHAINSNLIEDWKELGKKHISAMAAFDDSQDYAMDDLEIDTIQQRSRNQVEEEPEETMSGQGQVGEDCLENCRPITRLISGTLPPPLVKLPVSTHMKRTIPTVQIHHATDLSSEGINSYTCTCGKTFSQMKRLNHHVRTSQRNLQKSFSCTFCPRRFTWGYMLRNHEMHVHKILRPKGHVACQICGSHFPSWKQLAHHKLQKHSRRKKTPACVQKISGTVHRRSI